MNQRQRNREIVQRYREGFTAAGIGRMYGLTDTRVYQILRELGIERRQRQRGPDLDLRRRPAA